MVQYTWQDDQFSWEFEFANELLEDMGMPALLLAVAGRNESLMTWNMQVQLQKLHAYTMTACLDGRVALLG